MRMRGAGGQSWKNGMANPEDDRQFFHARCELIADRHHFAATSALALLTFGPHYRIYWRHNVCGSQLVTEVFIAGAFFVQQQAWIENAQRGAQIYPRFIDWRG